MHNFHHLHLSNRTEILYQQLKERLFVHSHPLTKRVIIVPSAAMKSWLMLQLAQDPAIGISAGIEVGFVEPTINRLFQTLSDKSIPFAPDSYEPSELELALALESAMAALANAYCASAHSVKQEWLPLLQYLGVSVASEKKLSKRVLKRIRALACNLAKVFRDYGLYGGEMIAEWQHEQSGWQWLLWQEMEVVFANWNYPARKLALFQMDPSLSAQNVQIHLFGLSFLAPLHHRFMQKIAAHLPVHYYFLSPCQKFWGDTLSDKESLRLQKYWDSQEINQGSLEALDEFLRDRNPLLANFGRLGREMSLQMESLDAYSSELYALPASILEIAAYQELEADDILMEDIPSPLTLLQAVQADIALLRTPDSNHKLKFENYDQTIQVHAAPKKMREVQVIYDALLSIIDKHVNDASPIQPGDIFVMAPNISEYAPFIRSVFESSESCLDIQLMDLQVPSEHPLIQAFLHLLSLSRGRWEASALLQLFDYPAFRARHRLTNDDVLVIQKWVKEARIYWGKDSLHRNQIFNKDYEGNQSPRENSIGTWEYGLGRLLEGLSMSAETLSAAEKSQYSPLDCIEASQGDLLGTVIHLIRSLQQDLRLLADGTELSLRDWSTYLACLFEAYFLPVPEDSEGSRILVAHIESLAKASKKLGESVYSFETIRRHLEERLQEETSIYRESSLHAVRFSSLLPMRAVPAKVIVLMGMGDGVFPRGDQTNTLNLLLESAKVDYYPARVDSDRYIFLEAILSARHYFILSYVSQEPGNAKCQSPSLLVKELVGYLDQAYTIGQNERMETPSKSCVFYHPLNAFHHSYFSGDGCLQSYSHASYLAALSYYPLEKQPRKSFLSEFAASCFEQENEHVLETTVTIKELLACAKNPLKVYVNQALGIYLERDLDRIVKDEEDLFLSDLHASMITKTGLFGSKSAALHQAEKSGQLPQSAFKALGTEKIGREIDQCLQNLKTLDTDAKGIFFMEFVERHAEPSFDGKGWKLPALSVLVPGRGIVKVVGRLDYVCGQGLVQVSQAQVKKDETKKTVELWPACLILRWAIEKYALPIIPQVVFIKGKKVKLCKINSRGLRSSEDALVDYLDYYFQAKASPSPFVPEWLPSILSANLDELKNFFKEDINEDFQPKFDPYLQWFKRNSPNAGLVANADQWQAIAQNLFAGMASEEKEMKSAHAMQEGAYDIS